MAAAAEQGHASVQQDGGDQRGVGDASQAFNTALKAPCMDQWEKKVEISISC